DDLGEFLRPVETLARSDRRRTAVDAKLHAIAVELDLVFPLTAERRLFDERAQLRLDELRHARAFRALARDGALEHGGGLSGGARARRVATPTDRILGACLLGIPRGIRARS